MMTPWNASPCLPSPRSRLFQWFMVLLCCCGVIVSLFPAQVDAAFAANPFPLRAPDALMLIGDAAGDQSGTSVSGVGDMNGDGLDDFVIGAPGANDGIQTQAGAAYLLFGRNATTHPWTPNPYDLSALDGVNGTALKGSAANMGAGFRVAGVRDVNGDGCDDMLIGTSGGSVAFLVFGGNASWPAALILQEGSPNVVAIVASDGGLFGYSVSGAGDVNGDGRFDVVIGAPRLGNPENSGHAYVLFGRPSNSAWPSLVDVATYMNNLTGFTVQGSGLDDECGTAVSGVGDVNGDGVDDVAVSCVAVTALSAKGVVAVVFGSSTLYPVYRLDILLNLPLELGFTVAGETFGDEIGAALAHVGDVNGDGMDDFAIGAPTARMTAGAAYVVFGRNASVTPWPDRLVVSNLNGTNGFAFTGSMDDERLGASVSPAGDVNVDGINDVLVGVEEAAPAQGRAYLLFGRGAWPATQNSSSLANGTTNTFEGENGNDLCGRSVALVGDVNGDGRGDFAFGCPKADSETSKTAVVFGPLFTPAPTTTPPTMAPTTASPSTATPSTVAPTTVAPTTVSPTALPTASPTQSTASPTTASPTTMSPTTASPTTASPTTSPSTATPTTSPTAATCATQGAFIPPGTTCVNGILVTSTNTTVPTGTTSTVTTSVTITGGASFEQPSGSTLVFVAGGAGGSGSSGSTSIAVQGGGCATIGGDAVVNFEADPSNGGEAGNTGTLVLVMADCVMGSFGSVSATTAFDGDECVAIGEGVQEASGNSISVNFGVSNTCGSKSSGMSTGALAGLIVGVSVVTAVVVVLVVKWSVRARNRRAQEDVKMTSSRW